VIALARTLFDSFVRIQFTVLYMHSFAIDQFDFAWQGQLLNSARVGYERDETVPHLEHVSASSDCGSGQKRGGSRDRVTPALSPRHGFPLARNLLRLDKWP
jgi:hypothetical protein